MAKLLVHLDEIEKASHYFTFIKKLPDLSFKYFEEVEVELNKFFGDPKSGSYSLLDRFKLE